MTNSYTDRAFVAHKTVSDQKSIAERDNDHVIPNKKQRTGGSPLEGKTKHHPIDIGDSQDIEMQEPSVDHGTSSDELFTDTRQARAISKPIILGAPRPVKTPAKQKYETRLGRHLSPLEVNETPNGGMLPESPDELFQEVDVDEVDAAWFTREAAAKRRKGSDLSPVVRPKKSVPPDIQEVPAMVSNGKQGRKMTPAARLSGEGSSRTSPEGEPESPDPLQQNDPFVEKVFKHPRKAMETKTGSQLAADCIQGDPNSTRIGHQVRHSDRQRGPPDTRDFRIRRLGYDGVPNLPDMYVFIVDRRDSTYYLDCQNPTLNASGSVTSEAPISTITNIVNGHNSGVIYIKNRHSHDHYGNNIALELMSEKQAVMLTNLLQELDNGIRVRTVSPDTMERMLLKKVEEAALGAFVKSSVRLGEDEPRRKPSTVKSPHFTSGAAGGRNGAQATPLNRTSQPTVISGRDRCQSSSPEHGYRSSVIAMKERAVEEPRPQLESDLYEELPTRTRKLRSTPKALVDKLRSPTPKIKYSQTGALGPAWKVPLVYPPDGKQRETVHFSDLERLDDDEFLNDSLVALFSKYLQHELEAQNDSLFKKMHFFNTYFYESLSRGSKSRRDINYNNVKRWTAKVNIFSRDFVIVPVNENLHWFVAIVCNLPHFRTRSQEALEEDEDIIEADNEDTTDTANNHADSSETAHHTQQSFEELSLEEKLHANGSLDDMLSSQHKSTPKNRGKKKKPRPSLQKYETDKPIIITLDSLGLARSSTVAAIKQYLVQEAKDKQGWDIDIAELKGMTAKSIPTQGNYSDCGLYMCMYLEQFMKDPYGFVEKILRREESKIRWPNHIDSTLLRSRMRDLIMELQQRQESQQSKLEIPEVGNILVDMRGPSPEPEIQESLLQNSADRPVSSQSVEDIRASKKRYIQLTKGISEDKSAGEDDMLVPSSPVLKPRKQQEIVDFGGHAVAANPNNPITIDDSPGKSRRGQSSRPSSSSSPVKSTSKRTHNSPGDLARQLKDSRTNGKVKSSSKSPSAHLKDTSTDQSDNESVTTEYLGGGNKSYRTISRNENLDGVKFQSDREDEKDDIEDSEEELKAKVAETQEQVDEIEDSQLEVQQLGAPPRAEEEEMLLDQHDQIT